MKALPIFVLLCGCYSSGNRRIGDDSILEKIQKGKTTKAELLALLGKPNAAGLSWMGSEHWTYMYAHAEVTGATFIPIVGPLVGGTTHKMNTLTIQLDQNGIVQNFTSSEIRGGSGIYEDQYEGETKKTSGASGKSNLKGGPAPPEFAP